MNRLCKFDGGPLCGFVSSVSVYSPPAPISPLPFNFIDSTSSYRVLAVIYLLNSPAKQQITDYYLCNPRSFGGGGDMTRFSDLY